MIHAADIKQMAASVGFDACGIARALPAESEAKYLDRWLSSGYQAGMTYMANHRELRLDPSGLVEGARSILSVALNYYPERRRNPRDPHIAYYAYGKDYHVVVKDKLRQLWQQIKATLPAEEAAEARVFTDSAPILERYWAWRAGLGWIGKNTNLILPQRGSFFFLGEIVTNIEVDCYDEPMPSRCGTCNRCLRACPTGALEQAGCLNASKCLSYLTIEHRGEIPAEQASKLGNRLYGCDTCQLVCPWNRFARPTEVEEFRPSESLLNLSKEEAESLAREDYNRIFAQSAVKRAKYEGLMRTVRTWEDNKGNGPMCRQGNKQER